MLNSELEPDRVLRLSRYYAGRLYLSLSNHNKGRIEFDELVSTGHLAGSPKRKEQSLWRWIKNAQIKLLIETLSSKKKLILSNGIVTDEINNFIELTDLYKVIRQLSLYEKHLIRLKYWEELTFKEMGSILCLAPSTVREVHFQPILKKLAELLK